MGAPGEDGPLPCILLTGALGSGKTTIVQELMRRPDMAGTALVVNEFGEVGLDHLLVSSAVETTLLMENGCMCCSLRGDVVDTVLGLFRDVERGALPPFRRILIETTGLADPVPIVRDLTASPALSGRVRLGSVCTVVDGLIGLPKGATAESQVIQADICIVTKDDLAAELEVDLIRERVQALNPVARVYLKKRDGLPATPDLEHVHDRAGAPEHTQGGGAHQHGIHGSARSWSIETGAPLEWAAVRDWLDLLYSLHGARLLRMKGLIARPDDARALLVQATGPVVSPPAWVDQRREEAGRSRLILIFRDLDPAELARSFEDATGARIGGGRPEVESLAAPG